MTSTNKQIDTVAFKDIYEQYKNLVFKTAYLMLGNTSDAEDVLQEVFISAYTYFASYDANKGAISTWLHRITINQCMAFKRKERFNYELPDDPLMAFSERESLSDTDSIINQEIIKQAISQLSDKLRAVVILRYYWELQYAEIARILNIPLGTVKSRIDFAFQTMRKIYQKMNEESHSYSLHNEENDR